MDCSNKNTAAVCTDISEHFTFYLRNSPTWSISHSVRVSSIAQRPNGHSCLSSLLLFSKTICYEREKKAKVYNLQAVKISFLFDKGE